MRTRYFIIIAGAMLALVGALALPSLTWARGPNGGPGRGPGGGMPGQNQSLVAVAAQVLNIPQADLVAQLQAGKTLKEIAGDKADAIVNAFIALRTDRLATMVTAGRMTQAEADQMLATMRANVTAQMSAPWVARGPGGNMGYVDEDGDGVCDHAGVRMGAGNQARSGRGQMGMGRNDR